VKCGARQRLEVDHIIPARHAPHLAYELSNTQTLCSRHHREKTAIEVGIAPLDPERQRWRDLLKQKGLTQCLPV
jgi:5-methylcytosine-specific restriction endonuclease McrA